MSDWIAGAVLASVVATAGVAGEHAIEINNSYFLNETTYKFSDRVYLTQDNIGAFEVVKGPFEDGAARCIGSGFVFYSGINTIEGICIFGEGEDTFTMSWKAGAMGAANSWEIVDGTGRYQGMTGSGLATTEIASKYQVMPLRRTYIAGTVTLPDK